jgi:hypothetical protein
MMNKLALFLFLIAIGSYSVHAQQQPQPSLPTKCCNGATTCSQAQAFALSGCSTSPLPARCRTNSRVDENFNECMKSGIWTNFTTGMKFSLKKE